MGRKANLQKQSTKEKRGRGKYTVNKIILIKTETEALVVVHIVLIVGFLWILSTLTTSLCDYLS